MDPVTNPYTPNAGAQPAAVVGRDDLRETFDVLLQRRAAGRDAKSMIITGLRGVGKTVLLGQFAERTENFGWVYIDTEVKRYQEDDFRRSIAGDLRKALFELSPRKRWDDKFKRAAAVLKSFTLSVDPSGALSAGLDVDAMLGHADRNELSADLTDLVVAVGEAAQSTNKGVVLLFDEVQFLTKPQLEALITALHKAVQKKLPLTMVAAGLPQIAELTGEAKSYSERLFTFPLIRDLDSGDAALALSEPARIEGVTWAREALDLAFEFTGGYPYFIQEFGDVAWRVAHGSVIAADDARNAQPLYEAKLDASFFQVRYARASELQRAYMRAMAGLGSKPQSATDVAVAMGRAPNQVATVRSNLIEMGLLYSPEYGKAAFTVPHFDKFMLRSMPELIVPPMKGGTRR